MKKLLAATVLSATGVGLAVLAVLAFGPLDSFDGTAQADPGGKVTTLAIDMVIDDNADTLPDNDDHTVGSIDRWAFASAGETVQFDVLVDAIPDGVGASDLKGFQYFLGFDDTKLTFTAQSHTSPGVNIIARHPQSCTKAPYYCFDLGTERVPEPPDSSGYPSPGVHEVFVGDSTLGSLVGGDTDPYGNAGGVLGRYAITVGATTPPGLYRIGLNDSPYYDVQLLDSAIQYIWDLVANGTDDDLDGAIDEDILLDRAAGYGVIAVGATSSDYDADGYPNVDETAKGCDPLDPTSTPEHCEGLDNDGDTSVDEGWPDSDGDTLKDCVDPGHPYYTDDDDDDDGFTDAAERCMTTDEQDACSELPPSPPNPWGALKDDAWPPDFDNNKVVDVADALTFLAAFPSAPGTLNYSRRLDMASCAGVIDVTDALVFLAHFPSACTNP